jgi:small subunit ribosomal protein S2
MAKKKMSPEIEEKTTLKSLVDELREHEKTKSEEDFNEKLTSEKKLKKKIEDVSDKEIEKISKKISKKEVEEEVETIKKQKENVDGKKETLIPLEDYVKCAVHLGTKVITPHMRKFVYKRRADGLAVINTASIDERLRETIDFMKSFEPNKIFLACKREAGWQGAEKFFETTGIRTFTKKYPSGITTNLTLDNFFEAELTIICDPWIDKNALLDTWRLKKPVISLCDTNNLTSKVTKVIPCNNKSKKSIGCILYILAREYCKSKKLPFNAVIEDFTGPLEEAKEE